MGSAMLYTVAVGVPIGLAALSASVLLRGHGRSERGVWLLALGLTLALPLWMLTRPTAPELNVWTPVVRATSAIELPTTLTLPVGPEAQSALGMDELLVFFWLLASATLVVRWAVSGIRLSRMSRAWRPETLHGVDVSVTSAFGPAVTGTLRPRIVLPEWVVSLPSMRRAL